MSALNICFYGEINRNIFVVYGCSSLFGAMKDSKYSVFVGYLITVQGWLIRAFPVCVMCVKVLLAKGTQIFFPFIAFQSIVAGYYVVPFSVNPSFHPLFQISNFSIWPASVAQLDAPSDWRPGGHGFNLRRGRQHSFVEIDHEIFSTVILSLPLIQEGQLLVSGERMCTILVNRLED